MIGSKKRLTVVGVALMATSLASSAFAGPAYNCKADKRLDVPMQFSAVIESNGRLHLSASAAPTRADGSRPTTAARGAC